MHELIYCEDQAEYRKLKALLAESFPGTIFEDASDFVHENRFEFKNENVEEKDFFFLALKHKFFYCCFGLQLKAMGKEAKELQAWLDEYKTQLAA